MLTFSDLLEVYQLLPMHSILPCYSQVSLCSLPAENSNRSGTLTGSEPTNIISREFCRQTTPVVAIPTSELYLDHALSAWEADSDKWEVHSYLSTPYQLCAFFYALYNYHVVWLYINGLQMALIKCSLIHIHTTSLHEELTAQIWYRFYITYGLERRRLIF